MSSPVTSRPPAGTAAEHYVVDVLAGWLVAAGGLGGSRLVRRRGRRPDASGGAV